MGSRRHRRDRMAVGFQSAIQKTTADRSEAGHLLDEKMSHTDHSKEFPPLAPGPPRMFAPHSSMAVSRPKKNSTACLACKAAKRKCSGPPSPCKACSSAGAESDCHFDPSRDLRRKLAVKRTIQELTDYKGLLDSLLSTLRLAHGDKIKELMVLIRNNGSMKDIAHAVGSRVTKVSDLKALSTATLSEDGDQNADVPSTEEFESKPRRHSELDKMSILPEEEQPHVESPRAASHPYARVTLESLCDIPIFRVPARPWTEITDDNELVSHLVSLYFTWDHPCAQFVDHGVFLDHMKRGDINSEFCTPLLVNSLLSMASAYSDSPDVFSSSGNTFSRGQNFFHEAERLLKAQEGHPALSNIQALLLLCSVLSCQGNVILGWSMLRQAVQMGQDIGLFVLPRAIHASSQDMSPEMERVRAVTAWGLYSLNLQMSMKLQRTANLAPPVSTTHVGGDHDVDWTPYPRSNQITYATKPAHLPRVRQGLAELTDIMVHIQELLYDEGLVMSFETLLARAEDPCHRLQRWLEGWPDASQIEKETVPQILILRIKCLQVIMNLLEILIERDRQGSMANQLRQTWCQQAEEMAQCLRIHRQSYGLKQIPSQVVDAVQAVLQVLVHHLEGSAEARHAFIELCRFEMALSQKFKPAADTIHAIQSLSQHGVVRLPTEAVAILDGSEFRKGQGLRERPSESGKARMHSVSVQTGRSEQAG